MNYFLLIVSCMLIDFTTFQPTESAQNLQADEIRVSAAKKQDCIIETTEFLAKIPLDDAIKKLAVESSQIGLDTKILAATGLLQLKDEFYRKLENRYPESCDGVIKQFEDLAEKVKCFKEESIGSMNDYLDIFNQDGAEIAVWAGLMCGYASKFKTEEAVESTQFFDFNNINRNNKDCIRQTAAFFSRIPLDESVNDVVKLTRDHKMTVFDFVYAEDRPLDPEYTRALLKIDSQEGCDNLIQQVEVADEEVECYAENVQGDTLAYVELSVMDTVKDVVLAYDACYFSMPLRKENCHEEVANFLNGIALDESVRKLVERSRDLGLTHVHFEAAKHKPLHDDYNRALREIEYPESCATIVERFSEIGDKVKCTGDKSFHFVVDWLRISKDKEAGDKVLAAWACGYASKLEEGMLETPETEPTPLTRHVGMSDERRKDCINEVGDFFAGLALDKSIEQLVEQLHKCKITYIDLVLTNRMAHKGLDDECSCDLLRIVSQQSCDELPARIETMKEMSECFKERLGGDLGAFMKLVALDGTGDAILADEACDYISAYRREQGEETSEVGGGLWSISGKALNKLLEHFRA